MTRAGRAYLAFVFVVLTTMTTRVGWIDWPLIFGLLVGVLFVLILAVLLIGLPAAALIALTNWVLGPDPAPSTSGGHQDAS